MTTCKNTNCNHAVGGAVVGINRDFAAQERVAAYRKITDLDARRKLQALAGNSCKYRIKRK